MPTGFLTQQIPQTYINVKTYGAIGNNSHDDTAAVQAALDAANAQGGGVVFFPEGIYICSTLLMYSYVHLRGQGMLVSELRLKGGTNGDLLWGGATNQGFINVTNQTSGGGNTGGLAEWGLHDMAFNGTKGTQTSGPSYCVEIYGYGFIIENCSFKNGFSGGLNLDWNGGSASPTGSDSMIANIRGCSIHENNGTGLIFGGPHDSFITNTEIYLSGTNDCYIGPHSGTCHLTACHCWSPEQSGSGTGVACLIETTTVIEGCQFEGSDLYQLVLLCSYSTVMGGAVFSNATLNGAGILLGQQSGDTPIPGSSYQSAGSATAVVSNGNMIYTFIHDCPNSNGHIRIRGDTGSGGNMIRCTMFSATGGVATTGNINAASFVEITSVGLTTGQANNNFTHMAGDFALRQPGSAQSLSNNSAINVATIGSTIVNNSGNVTGVTMNTGFFAGQVLVVSNKGTGSVTMAASSSNVVDGSSCVIASQGMKIFVWNSIDSVWYHTA